MLAAIDSRPPVYTRLSGASACVRLSTALLSSGYFKKPEASLRCADSMDAFRELSRVIRVAPMNPGYAFG